jgi:membrane protein
VVAVAVLLTLAGTLGVAGSVQKFYERILGARRRHRTDLLRLLLWVAALCLWLAVDAVLARVAHGVPAGVVLEGLAVLVVTTGFFWWSTHLLLGGARSWPSLVRPAVVTAVLWLVLEGGSALYFSTAITNDNRIYGAVGVIFSLMTWFVLVAVVLVLGALLGEVWEERRATRRPHPDPGSDAAPPDSGTQPSTNAASR